MRDPYGDRRAPTYIEGAQGATLEQGWNFLDAETGRPVDFTAGSWSARAEFNVNGTPVKFRTTPGAGIDGTITLGDEGNLLLTATAAFMSTLPAVTSGHGYAGGLEVIHPDGKVDTPFSVIWWNILRERVF